MKSTGYILNGKYVKGDVDQSKLIDHEQSTWKEASHDKQRREHRKDLIQPYKDGKPNMEFIEQYPEEAKQYGFIKGE